MRDNPRLFCFSLTIHHTSENESMRIFVEVFKQCIGFRIFSEWIRLLIFSMFDQPVSNSCLIHKSVFHLWLKIIPSSSMRIQSVASPFPSPALRADVGRASCRERV